MMQEEREDKRDKRRNKELSRILATVVHNKQITSQESCGGVYTSPKELLAGT